MPRGVPNPKEPQHVSVEEARFGLPSEDVEVLAPPQSEPAPAPPPLQSEAEPAQPLLPDGFSPMDDAPKDGRALWLLFGGAANVPLVVDAFWRKTREWKGGAVRWEELAFWAHVHTTQRIHSTPIGWSR